MSGNEHALMRGNRELTNKKVNTSTGPTVTFRQAIDRQENKRGFGKKHVSYMMPTVDDDYMAEL